jgi:hypothetical protein
MDLSMAVVTAVMVSLIAASRSAASPYADFTTVLSGTVSKADQKRKSGISLPEYRQWPAGGLN